MNLVILYLGLDVNILPKNSWEQMGKLKLVWSPIQLHLAIQFKIYPIGRLENVIVDMDGIQSSADFEVIKLEDEIEPYPTLLGIEWDFDNNVIINLKKQTMMLESENLKLITLLDMRGDRHTKLVKEEAEDENIGEMHNIRTQHEDYFNPTINGEPSWRSICSYDTDS